MLEGYSAWYAVDGLTVLGNISGRLFVAQLFR